MAYAGVPTALPGVLILEPGIVADERGSFYESFNLREFERVTGLKRTFVQDNHVHSVARVLRGLHFQIRQTQAKLIRATRGEIFDVVVDVRRSSPTFRQHVGVHLSAANRRQLWVPEGFAHGYLVLSDTSEVEYKVTEYWSAEHDRCLIWNDPTLSIAWPIDGRPTLSAKDAVGKRLDEIELFD